MSQASPSHYQYEFLAIIAELRDSCTSLCISAEKVYKNPYDCLAALRGYQYYAAFLLQQAERQFDVPLATDVRSLSFIPGVWQKQRDGPPIPLTIRFTFQHPQHIQYEESCPF